MITHRHAHKVYCQLTACHCLALSIAVLIGGAVVPCVAGAATYYLDTTGGSDGNPGTSDAPWQSLAMVQAGAVPGDTVVILSADVNTYAAPWPTQATYQARALKQFEITWTFDTYYPVGQFANGDLWVVGPVNLIGFDPPSTAAGDRIINGSMVNPNPGGRQGYDSAMPYNAYDAALNVACGVSVGTPLTVPPGSSLVSTISLPTVDGKTALQRAAILTVLTAPAQPGDFRPPYCGTDKTVKFNTAMLDPSLLQSLPPVAATPSLAEVESYFAAPWIDHGGYWYGDYMHPSSNMPDYGREMHTEIGIGGLMLHLSFTPAEKETLLCRYVQLGIDLGGVALDGGNSGWTNDGGEAGGRKWPILFAGLMLHDDALKSVGVRSGDYLYQNGYGPGHGPPDYIHFGEDDQTFYVAQLDVDATHSSNWNPDSRDGTRTPYEISDIGLPEWGIRHSTDPYQSNKELWTMYRNVAGPPFHATALAALLTPGGQEAWNHNAYFDYSDRYMTMTAPGGPYAGWWRSMSAFTESMWDTYRAQCGLVRPAVGSSAPCHRPLGIGRSYRARPWASVSLPAGPVAW